MKNTVTETNCLKVLYMQQMRLVNWKKTKIEKTETKFRGENQFENSENAKEMCGTQCSTCVIRVRKGRENVEEAVHRRNNG